MEADVLNNKYKIGGGGAIVLPTGGYESKVPLLKNVIM